MRFIILILLSCVAFSSAFGELVISQRYHKDVGIPLAGKIKALEEINHSRNVRIVGGNPASGYEHPYMGGLLIQLENIAGLSVCGSALVTSNRLITAAHCWFDGSYQATLFTVVLGTNKLFSGGLRFTTRDVVTHPQFIPNVRNSDIAVIRLETSVPFTESIQPIPLANIYEVDNNTFAGEWAVAVGYGFTSDQQTGIGLDASLNQVDVQVITQLFCRTVYGPAFVNAGTLCTLGAGGVGICNGDMGSPLVTTINNRKVLIGISSFVANIGCQTGNPSAFARITTFYSFILGHL